MADFDGGESGSRQKLGRVPITARATPDAPHGLGGRRWKRDNTVTRALPERFTPSSVDPGGAAANLCTARLSGPYACADGEKGWFAKPEDLPTTPSAARDRLPQVACCRQAEQNSPDDQSGLFLFIYFCTIQRRIRAG